MHPSGLGIPKTFPIADALGGFQLGYMPNNVFGTLDKFYSWGLTFLNEILVGFAEMSGGVLFTTGCDNPSWFSLAVSKPAGDWLGNTCFMKYPIPHWISPCLNCFQCCAQSALVFEWRYSWNTCPSQHTRAHHIQFWLFCWYHNRRCLDSDLCKAAFRNEHVCEVWYQRTWMLVYTRNIFISS